MNDEEGAIFTLVTGNNALSLNAGTTSSGEDWFRERSSQAH